MTARSGSDATLGRRRVIAAEVHGFRHETSAWPELLERVRELGVTHVTTLVPWSEVEPRPYEMEHGEHRPAVALDAFLDAVSAAGLRAIVRVGPRMRADLSLAGLPEHVVYDRAVMARSARGSAVLSTMPPRMFPWPSYESAAYRAHVERYVTFLAEAIRPRLAPHGIVDAVDIEDPSAVLIRAGAYARDYHPDSVEAFRDFLRARYETPERLCTAWGVNAASFGAITPPTRFSAGDPRDLPRHLDWARFQEHSALDFRRFLVDSLARAGIVDIETSTVLDTSALGTPTGAVATSQAITRVGVELVARADEIDAIRRRIGPVVVASVTPFARVLVGGSPFGRARDDSDVVASTLVAVAMGIRSLELSMGVAHERWWGAPIDEDGSRTPSFDSVASLVRALAELEFESLDHRHEVVVLVPGEYARLVRVTHLFGPFGAGLLDFAGRSFAEATLDGTFGFSRSIQHAFLDRLAALERNLDRARIAFSILEPEAFASLDAAPKLVLVPTFDFVDEATRSAVDEAARRGCRVVVGPDVPRFDGSMNPAASLGVTERIADLDDDAIRARLVDLAREVGVAPVRHDPSSEARAFELVRDGEVVGFVLANPGRTDGSVVLSEESTLVDPIRDAVFGAAMPIPAPAKSARLLLRSTPRSAPSRSR